MPVLSAFMRKDYNGEVRDGVAEVSLPGWRNFYRVAEWVSVGELRAAYASKGIAPARIPPGRPAARRYILGKNCGDCGKPTGLGEDACLQPAGDHAMF